MPALLVAEIRQPPTPSFEVVVADDVVPEGASSRVRGESGPREEEPPEADVSAVRVLPCIAEVLVEELVHCGVDPFPRGKQVGVVRIGARPLGVHAHDHLDLSLHVTAQEKAGSRSARRERGL